MAFHARTVVLGDDGSVAVIVLSRRLKAKTLDEAKREVDLGDWDTPGVAVHAVEIVNSTGGVLAVRRYRGKAIYANWT